MKDKFDLAMMCIDANIQKDANEIKKEIVRLTGYSNINRFDHFFFGLTNMTLYHYITIRKLFFAAEELRFNKDKSITEIALDYGYSEQSALNKGFSSFYGTTPNKVRKGKDIIPDNKIRFSDFTGTTNKRIQRIIEQLDVQGYINGFNTEYLVSIEEAAEEFNFPLELCYQIADIADQMEIHPYALIEACFQKYVESHEVNDFTYKEEYAISLGISSNEELNAICKYFNCEYYDLDRLMIELYKNNI